MIFIRSTSLVHNILIFHPVPVFDPGKFSQFFTKNRKDADII